MRKGIDVAHNILHNMVERCCEELSRGTHSFTCFSSSISDQHASFNIYVRAMSGQFGNVKKMVKEKIEQVFTDQYEEFSVRYHIDEDCDGADYWVYVNFKPNQEWVRFVRTEKIIAEKTLELLDIIKQHRKDPNQRIIEKNKSLLKSLGLSTDPPKPPKHRVIREGKDPVKPKSLR